MPNDFDPYSEWLGIPPEEQPADHYRLLGIEQFESDTELIKKAAEAKIEFLRTFQLGKRFSFSQKLMAEVASARVCLLNSEKKAAYDAQLHGHSESAQEKARLHAQGIEPQQGIRLQFGKHGSPPILLKRTAENALPRPVEPPSPLTPRRNIEPQAELNLAGGSKSPVAPLPDDRGTSQSAPARPRRKKRILVPIIGLVIVVLAIIGAGITLYLSGEAKKQPPAQVAEQEADRKAKQEADRKAKMKEEGDSKAKQEADRKAQEEAERKAKEEAERKAKEEAERKAKEEAERKAKEEAERKAKEEAERKANKETERNSEAERTAKVTRWPNGQKKSEIHYKNGKRDGLVTLWHKNGKKESERYYKNDKLEGLLIKWYPSGAKRLEAHLKNGKRDGLETFWHENGPIDRAIYYKNGKEVSRKVF